MQHVSWHRESESEKVMKEYTNSQMDRLINEHIHSERDRKILKRRLIDGVCYEPLAEEFGLSDKQIKNIIYRAERKLFALLK